MEEDLIRHAQTGDTLAFRMLVERYSPIAWQLARVLVPDSGQAEDALQHERHCAPLAHDGRRAALVAPAGPAFKRLIHGVRHAN
jgi:hypothetical protein